ncbi:MAG: ABC transporter substrate-binding protein [Thermomicrobiales bacterium]
MNRDHGERSQISRRTIMRYGAGIAGGAILAQGAQRAAAQEDVTLRVIGFRVLPEEQGSPLDTAYQQFLEDFQAAHPNVTVDALETPPEFDTQLLVDLAAGTAPDIWSQDASTLARLVDGGHVLDMRQAVELVPELNLDRFFPTVLAIHEAPDGAIYDLPNDYTPMVIYYNPRAFEKAGVPVPTADWNWDDLLEKAKLLTIDSEGRNAADAEFDAENIVQYGFRVRQFVYEWIYHVWANGSDVISEDGTTVSGFLDSPETIETIQFLRDLVLEHHVSPPPSTLDQLNQSVGFPDRFLRGEFAMFHSGHWELVGLQNSAEYAPEAVAVVGQPARKTNATVIYESSFAIRADLEGDKLLAACQFVNAATDTQYQDTKVITGIAIAGNQASAEAAVPQASAPELEQVFIDETANGRAPYGAKFATWPAVELLIDSMMERILAGGDVAEEVASAVEEINRELGA